MGVVDRHIMRNSGMRHGKDADAAQSLGGPFADNVNEIDLRSVLQIIWRRQRVIFGIIIIFLALTAIALHFLKPSYSARSLILIDNQSAAGGEIASLLAGGLDDTSLLNEIEILRSRLFLRKAVQEFKLLYDPEFNPDATPETAAANKFKSFNFNTASNITTPELERAINKVGRQLTVRSVPGASVVQIELQTQNPSKSAMLANRFAQLYLDERQASKDQKSERIMSRLDERLVLLENAMREKLAELEAFKNTEIPDIDPSGITPEHKKSALLQAQLIEAQNKQITLISRLKTLKQLARNPQQLLTANDVATSRSIQTLRTQALNIEREIAALSNRYGQRHPQMMALLQEKEELSRKLKSEAQKVISALQSEVDINARNIAALKTQLDADQDTLNQSHIARNTLLKLEREAQTAQNVYSTFLQNVERARLQQDLQGQDAKILSYAVPPLKPTFPNIPLFMSLSFIMALFTGLALAFLLEKTDNTIRSASQIEALFGFACYALIPKADIKKHDVIADYVIKRPSSTVSEAVRTLRTVLNLRAHNQNPKIVMVTSSFPGEGKTTMSCWLARLAAKSGERVLLIDSDLRRSNVHKTMGVEPAYTLIDYLTGKNPLRDIIQRDQQTKADIIYAASAPNSALDLINGPKFKEMLEKLQDDYDLIILDSPACLAVSDARVLSSMADHTLYTVAWDQTPREIVAGGLKQFTDMGLENLSFVLSNVDIKRHVRYGYGDSVYYYGRYHDDKK